MAIAFVNSTGATVATAASTWSLALPAVTAGSAVVVGVGVSSSSVTVSTMTDNSGATWKKAVAHAAPRNAFGSEIWYATNVGATSTRVSVTLSGNDSGSIASACFTGFSTANPLGPVGSSASTAAVLTSIHGAATVTPLTSGVAILFSRLAVSTIGTITTGASYTAWISTNTCAMTYGQYWIQTAATATDGRYTTTSKANSAQAIAYFYDTTPTPRAGWLTPRTLLGAG